VKTKHILLVAGALAVVACGSDKKGLDGLGGLGGNANGDDSSADGGVRDGGRDGSQKETLCGKHSVKSDRAIPDMLIVLDRSASMAPSGNDRRTDRWRGSATAVSQLVTSYGTGVNFGLMTFPGGGQQGGGRGGFSQASCTPGEVDVEVGPDNGAAINQAISRMGPGGYTPTAATLDAALAVIGAPTTADQDLSTVKYVLLVTDGDPNCSPGFQPGMGMGGSNEDPVARMESIAAIEKLTDAGIKTYVVGYETAGTNFAAQLDLMAAAGGTGEDMHRSVESAADLAATFEELASNATTCSYRLVEKVDVSFVSVTVGGKARKYETDWRLESDERTVTLVGTACEDARKGGVFTVDVVCEPVIGI
jgi:von Willebrand factor type A domain